jgi:uncharacterized protein (UPF0332 family)
VNEFEECVKRGGLKLFPTVGPDAIELELRAAREDLADAEFLFEHEMPKRTTITAYYSMFHAARAGVLAKGYAEKSHYRLLVAFREFYDEDDEGSEPARGIERARFDGVRAGRSRGNQKIRRIRGGACCDGHRWA